MPYPAAPLALWLCRGSAADMAAIALVHAALKPPDKPTKKLRISEKNREYFASVGVLPDESVPAVPPNTKELTGELIVRPPSPVVCVPPPHRPPYVAQAVLEKDSSPTDAVVGAAAEYLGHKCLDVRLAALALLSRLFLSCPPARVAIDARIKASGLELFHLLGVSDRDRVCVQAIVSLCTGAPGALRDEALECVAIW